MTRYTVARFLDKPIITRDLDPGNLDNINGPSLIRVPDWCPGKLGKYYLYFAHHRGSYIRLAYADALGGPWQLHPGGTLRLEQTHLADHIASPDVHVNHDRQTITMYYHGCSGGPAHFKGQRTAVARSTDGLHFTPVNGEILGPFYFRVFQHEGWHYAVAKSAVKKGGGVLLRSRDGVSPFEAGPEILARQRHVALRKRGNTLEIFYSRGEDNPERILLSTMALAGDWRAWSPSEPVDLLAPETDYEGADRPRVASSFGAVHRPVRQLRDPDIFIEGDRVYMLYACAGETSLAIAELCET